MIYPLLERIQAPGDVKLLSEKELPELCEEIRRFLIQSVTATGGHLSSNLGVVELTVALHRMLDFPQDKLLFGAPMLHPQAPHRAARRICRAAAKGGDLWFSQP